MINQKKMENAFISTLATLLSKRYQYVIVADRGFGNARFIELCKKTGFHYILRVNDNILLELEGKQVNMKDMPPTDCRVKLLKSDIPTRVIINSRGKKNGVC